MALYLPALVAKLQTIKFIFLSSANKEVWMYRIYDINRFQDILVERHLALINNTKCVSPASPAVLGVSISPNIEIIEEPDNWDKISIVHSDEVDTDSDCDPLDIYDPIIRVSAPAPLKYELTDEDIVEEFDSILKLSMRIIDNIMFIVDEEELMKYKNNATPKC